MARLIVEAIGYRIPARSGLYFTSQGAPSHYLECHGGTVELLWADAQRQCEEQGIAVKRMQIVSLHNRRADWEAIYGPVSPDLIYGFSDPVLRPPLVDTGIIPDDLQ